MGIFQDLNLRLSWRRFEFIEYFSDLKFAKNFNQEGCLFQGGSLKL